MKNARSGIYCIENKTNGKKYVGQGLSVEKRMKRSHEECKVLCAAIKKYGKENFIRYVILYCEKEELDYYESSCITIFNSHASCGGYNVGFGGSAPMSGLKHSEESKKKMREVKRPSGKDHPSYGTHPSDETKEKQRLSRIGRKHSPETIKKMKASNKRATKGKFQYENHVFGKKRFGASSAYHGVFKHIKKWKDKQYVYWDVIIQENGKRKSIGGSYKTELLAARVYDKYVIENKLPNPLNFPEDYGIRE